MTPMFVQVVQTMVPGAMYKHWCQACPIGWPTWVELHFGFPANCDSIQAGIERPRAQTRAKGNRSRKLTLASWYRHPMRTFGRNDGKPFALGGTRGKRAIVRTRLSLRERRALVRPFVPARSGCLVGSDGRRQAKCIECLFLTAGQRPETTPADDEAVVFYRQGIQHGAGKVLDGKHELRMLIPVRLHRGACTSIRSH